MSHCHESSPSEINNMLPDGRESEQNLGQNSRPSRAWSWDVECVPPRTTQVQFCLCWCSAVMRGGRCVTRVATYFLLHAGSRDSCSIFRPERMNAPTCSSMRGADRERETGLDNWHAPPFKAKTPTQKWKRPFFPQKNITDKKENVEIGGKK